MLEIARTNRVLQSMPVAMEIGATPNAKGKGGKKGGKKGDGKNSKGDSKGKGKGTQQAPQNPNKDKSCFYCGKQGHLKSECRKRISDEKNAQGKGSSKGKPKAKANPGSGKPRPNAANRSAPTLRRRSLQLPSTMARRRFWWTPGLEVTCL